MSNSTSSESTLCRTSYVCVTWMDEQKPVQIPLFTPHGAELTCEALKKQLRIQHFCSERIVLVDNEEKPIFTGSLIRYAGRAIKAKPASARKSGFNTRVNFAPHYKSITGAGEYGYFSNIGRKPLPFALAEFVDNSISAVAKTDSKKQSIRVSFENDVVSILDNGSGMDAASLQDFATFALDPESRGVYRSDSSSTSSQVKTGYLNARISKFGVGSKQAAFYIGNALTVVTKMAKSKMACEFTLSVPELAAKYKNKEDVYVSNVVHLPLAELVTQQLGKRGLDQHPEVLQLLQLNDESSHYTLILVSGIKREFREYFVQQHESIAQELAQVYHFYLHGLRGANAISTISPLKNLDMRLSIGRHKYNLRETNDFISVLLENQKAIFPFHLRVPIVNTDGSKHAIVLGFLYYFPFINGRETCPQRASDLIDEEEDADVVVSTSAKPIGGHFECYWQGRLIPFTGPVKLKFMEAVFDKSVLCDIKHRVRGVLFFGEEFDVTMNKLKFVNLGLLSGDDVDFNPGPYLESRDRPQRSYKFTKACSILREFVKKAMQKYDREFEFIDKLQVESVHPIAAFKSLRYNDRIFSQGDRVIICIKNKKTFGKIAHFTVDRGQWHSTNQVLCSGGLVHLYEDVGIPGFSAVSGVPQKSFSVRFMEKTKSQEDIEAEYRSFLQAEKPKWPEKLEVYLCDIAPPSSVEAGYEFPAAKFAILGFYDPIARRHKRLKKVPVLSSRSSSKLLVRQSLCVNGVEVWAPEGHAEPDVGVHSKSCQAVGENIMKFEIIDPPGGKEIVTEFRFRVVPGPPVALIQKDVVDTQSNLMSMPLGELSSINVAFQLLDEFGNGCVKEDVIGKLRFEHPSFELKELELAEVKGTEEQQGWFHIKQARLLSDVPLESSSVPVSFTVIRSADAHDAAEIGSYTVHAVAGQATSLQLDSAQRLELMPDGFLQLGNRDQLPMLQVHVCDRFGNLTTKPPDSLKRLSMQAVCPDSKVVSLNGSKKCPVKVNANGVFILDQLVEVRDGFGNNNRLKVSLFLSTSHGVLLELPLVLVPGSGITSVLLCLSEADGSAAAIASRRSASAVASTDYTVQVGSTLKPFVLLVNDAGEVLRPPFAPELIAGIRVRLSWVDPDNNDSADGIALGSDGYLPQFFVPTRIERQKTLVEITLIQSTRLGQRSTNGFLLSKRTLRLQPGQGKQWKASLQGHGASNDRGGASDNEIMCGVPLGDCLKLWLEDAFGNVANPDSIVPEVRLGNSQQTMGDFSIVKHASNSQFGGVHFTIPKAVLCGLANTSVQFIVLASNFQPKTYRFKYVPGVPRELCVKLASTGVSSSEHKLRVAQRYRLSFMVFAVDKGNNPFPVKNTYIHCSQGMQMRQSQDDNFKSSIQIEQNASSRSCDQLLDFTFRAEHETTSGSITIKTSNRSRIEPASIQLQFSPWTEQVCSIEVCFDSNPEGKATAGQSIPNLRYRLIDCEKRAISITESMVSAFHCTILDPNNADITPLYGDMQLVDDGTALSLKRREESAIFNKAGIYKFSMAYCEPRSEVRALLLPQENTLVVHRDYDVAPAIAAQLMIEDRDKVFLGGLTIACSEDSEYAVVSSDLRFRIGDRFGNMTNDVFTIQMQKSLRQGVTPKDARLTFQKSPRQILEGGRVLALHQPAINLKANPTFRGQIGLIFAVDFRNVLLKVSESVQISSGAESRAKVQKQRELIARLSNYKNLNNQRTISLGSLSTRLQGVKRTLAPLLQKHNCPNVEKVVWEKLEKFRQSARSIEGEIRFIPSKLMPNRRWRETPTAIDLLGNLLTTTNEGDCRIVSQLMSIKLNSTLVETRQHDYHQVAQLPLDNLSPFDPRSLLRPDSNAPGHPKPVLELIKPSGYLRDKPKLFLQIFGPALGSTFVMDDRRTAEAYRKQFIRTHRRACPTIYTRDDMILDRSGHSGGDSYRVRSLRELRQVVGIEPSDQLRNRQDVRDSIVELERALRLMQEVRDILKDEDKAKQALREVREAQASCENELAEIESGDAVSVDPRSQPAVLKRSSAIASRETEAEEHSRSLNHTRRLQGMYAPRRGVSSSAPRFADRARYTDTPEPAMTQRKERRRRKDSLQFDNKRRRF